MTYIQIGKSAATRCRTCGPACNCASCCRAFGGLAERYIREEDDEDSRTPQPSSAAPASGAAAAGRISGWGVHGIPFAGARSLSGFAASITARDPRSNVQCSADERRIHPIVEPSRAELVNVEARYLANPGQPRQLQRAAYEAYVRMKAAAEADGIAPRLLTVTSGYRSVARQRQLWEDAVRRYGSPQAARKWVAPPGGSAHHTGRAVDLWLGTANSSRNIAALRATAPYRWLVCNAARFGFFPYAVEPWHWEYNPPELATGRPAPPPPRGQAATQVPAASPPGIVSVRGIRIAAQIAPQLAALLAAAEADGVPLSGWGYRSREKQIELRRKHCGPTHYEIWEKPASQCRPPTAPPGRSMHEQGLAVDFTHGGRTLDSNSPGFHWLVKNAARFGLKNLPSEPWHWSVNGR